MVLPVQGTMLVNSGEELGKKKKGLLLLSVSYSLSDRQKWVH